MLRFQYYCDSTKTGVRKHRLFLDHNHRWLLKLNKMETLKIKYFSLRSIFLCLLIDVFWSLTNHQKTKFVLLIYFKYRTLKKLTYTFTYFKEKSNFFIKIIFIRKIKAVLTKKWYFFRWGLFHECSLKCNIWQDCTSCAGQV